MSLHQLVYLSQSTGKPEKEALAALWAQAKANNARIDVTGSLFYNGGWFMQVLEGPAPTLATLYDKISKDPRHHDLRLLYNEPAAFRTFVRWTMNMTNLEERQADKYQELVDIIEAAKTGRKIYGVSPAVTLLNTFKA
ncbi:BLUF domain-containing protein [Pseudoduganella sp. SL102]|uniref:BLUF domain-containing protein n=1 Tax=Pseudoduganella sp. SL102 TaxID=2995154 RepID=UPI00248D293E|nr:BLUF domain-containing protein [Pseudoduganella sp. SL102]WBS00379.1 BLUF domain-containing protein [Pseudoduganella sp. SL102]